MRCAPHSLSLVGMTLRGIAWKTKTCKRGVPFACLTVGLLGEGLQKHWGSAYVEALNAWRDLVPNEEAHKIDFLLPSGVDATETCLAMSDTRALSFLHRILAGGGVPQAKVYVKHSAKTTLLSWSAQMLIREELRTQQGHHKSSAGAAPATYSRDDVNLALASQEQVLTRIHEGWRPIQAQQRGSLPPLAEPEVLLGSLDVCLRLQEARAGSLYLNKWTNCPQRPRSAL